MVIIHLHGNLVTLSDRKDHKVCFVTQDHTESTILEALVRSVKAVKQCSVTKSPSYSVYFSLHLQREIKAIFETMCQLNSIVIIMEC